MYTFLRQHRIFSSLKKYDRDVAFYKAVASVRPMHPAVRKMYTHAINRHLQLHSVDEILTASSRKKPLAVILAWLNAKQNHIEKYCNLYISRGFDVLTATMATKDFLFPLSGSQVIAKNVLDYFITYENYTETIVHALSVGGYLLGEMFVQMRKDPEKCKDITSRIQGVIFDSFVDFDSMPTAFPRAMVQNPIGMKILEWYTSAYLTLMFNVSTKHYVASSKNMHNPPLKSPALFFVSEADKTGNPADSQTVMENWQVRGIDVKMKCWKDSKHVCHLYMYPDEYMAEIDKFLSKVNLLPRKL